MAQVRRRQPPSASAPAPAEGPKREAEDPSSGPSSSGRGSWLSSEYDATIWALAGPTLLALASDPLLAVVDTAIIGQLGSQDLVGQLALARYMGTCWAGDAVWQVPRHGWWSSSSGSGLGAV